MCGIAGIFNVDGHLVDLNLIMSMTRQMAHRGPDGEGFYLEQNIALGHKRLSILDTSENGAQPMKSKNREWIVVFNGCIYNFRELKKDLVLRGHIFISGSDTEVVCEGLAAYGIDIFHKFNGMFAIAALHVPTSTLYLTRDRYGIKPLYYCLLENTILFGSEIKAFLKHPKFKVELNFSALNEYFTFQNLFSHHTLFRSVFMLPPATTMTITSKKKITIQSKCWWDYDFSVTDEKMSFETAKEETTRLFVKGVEKQMIADVPVGSYLSGGMDSGSITAIASRHMKRLSTFTAGFDMSEVTGVETNYDERRDAELIANHFKTEHYEQVINAGDLRWSLPRVVWHLEDLRVGMSYPNYYISRLASKFVKVCLQGTGGDELYGGYPWRYYRIFQSLDQKSFYDNYYGFWQRLIKDEEKKKLFQPIVFKQIDIDEPRTVFENVFSINRKLKYDSPEQHISNSLYFEIKTFLPGLLLVGDKLSMANGLEERFPFLDNNLVDFAQKIPIRHKLGNFESMKRIDENILGNKRKNYQEYDDGKNVLRKAMMDFLPESVLNRKKQGFSAPDESWYRGENANYVKELLLSKDASYQQFINPEYVKQIVKEHIHDRINHRLLIWSLMNFEWWCRLFLENHIIE